MAWTPIASVASAASSSEIRVMLDGTLRRLLATLRRMRQPLEARLHHQEHHRDERDRAACRRRRRCAPRRCTTPTAKASRHQAVTSSIAAQVSASAPSFVCVMRWSARMRASTGNAVIDIATPRKSAKCVNGTSLVEKRGIEIERERRPEHERQRDARVRRRQRRSQLAAQHVAVQLEADEEHVDDDAELREHAEIGRHVAAAGDRRRPPARRGRAATGRAGCRRRLRRSPAAARSRRNSQPSDAAERSRPPRAPAADARARRRWRLRAPSGEADAAAGAVSVPPKCADGEEQRDGRGNHGAVDDDTAGRPWPGRGSCVDHGAYFT